MIICNKCFHDDINAKNGIVPTAFSEIFFKNSCSLLSFSCMFSKERERKGMELGRWGAGENMGVVKVERIWKGI